MARARKTHVQQQIRWPNAAGNLRGVKREAAKGRGKRKVGRPKKPNAGVPHLEREAFKPSEPVHVTLRALPDIGRLRRRETYKAVREASITVLKHEDFRIVHLSVQGTHVHLLVEATGRAALSDGMKAFGISAAKHLNSAVSNAGSWWERRRMTHPPKRRKGSVFADRYHAVVIRTPKQARHELAYVLNNWRKHGEDRRGTARSWKIDPFATGWLFQGWKERQDEPFAWKLRDTYDPMPVWWPKTWLLTEGWRRHGLISIHEVPGARYSV